MKPRQPKDTWNAPRNDDSQTTLEATEWLVRLQDTDFDPEEPYQDPLQRQCAFLDWLKCSPRHVQAFMEVVEVERRVCRPDPQHLINVHELLDAVARTAAAVPLRTGGAQSSVAAASGISSTRNQPASGE